MKSKRSHYFALTWNYILCLDRELFLRPLWLRLTLSSDLVNSDVSYFSHFSCTRPDILFCILLS